jgi:hypothetical protein
LGVEQALLAYEQQRLEPTAKLTLDNRETGPERVLQLVEDRCPNGFVDIHDHFSDAELGEIAERYKKLAGFNRDALAHLHSEVFDEHLVRATRSRRAQPHSPRHGGVGARHRNNRGR